MHRSFPEQSIWRWVLSPAVVFILAGGALAPAAAAECQPGIYVESPEAFVVLGAAVLAPGSGQRYLFLDGRRGSTASPARHKSLHHFVAKAERSDEQMLRRVCQWVVPKVDFSEGGWYAARWLAATSPLVSAASRSRPGSSASA